ncbi:GNAT family N-acetyltransferase [Litoribacterium kuwaitense]|uniref:GNAT family N-acetyltransferase n=1 Tax=Litoribacterium kuwaitense TaxID=1398745 RepID=UPI0028B0876B|nr:GNAT family N-acetyltransferase [Litoribacterium kuwaitense]
MELIKGWLQQDYVSIWFGDVEDWLLEIRGRKDKYSFIHHFLLEDSQGKKPIGFAQYYDYSKVLEEFGETPQPVDTYGIDFMIGYKELIGQGVGKQLVRLISEKILEDHPNAVRIVADPSVDGNKINVASIKVLEANGFNFDSVSGFYILNL